MDIGKDSVVAKTVFPKEGKPDKVGPQSRDLLARFTLPFKQGS